MLNWFTFGIMFISLVTLLVICIAQGYKLSSEDYTVEHLINLQKHIIDELENEKENLKKQIEENGGKK